jgi:hypothetical protein
MPSRRERKLAGGGGRFVVIAAEDETPGREDPTPGLGRHGKAGDQFPDTTQRQHGPGPRDEVKCSSVRAEPLPGAVSQFPPRRGQPVRSQLLVGTNGERCRRRPLLLHDWSRSPATAGRRPPRAGTDDEKQSDPVGAPHRKLTAPSVDGSAQSRAHRMQPTYTRAHERRSRRRRRSRAGAGARHSRRRDNRSASCTRGRGRARCAAWLALAPEAHVARALSEVFTRSSRPVGV